MHEVEGCLEEQGHGGAGAWTSAVDAQTQHRKRDPSAASNGSGEATMISDAR